MIEGYVDTNVFLHAQAHDAHTPACRALLRAAAAGTLILRLDPLVVHELTYVLPRYVKAMTRADVALYCRSVLQWPGIHLEERPFWLAVLETWEADDRLSWTDAVLLNRARDTGLPVWSRNHRDFTRHDLPDSTWPVDPE
ncbi:PIN domain-containing protein [Sulfobacillus harzensis]|uniref:Type II toxin-antitoxin system VapC family toxin n=1 Tax=Sulfobacillus harzensis TaxID=2729629 RepID=A0A7Y0Q1Z5_9FIRM|nr:PIN domain-containing protein [Sulfobacillus harzensis]NMP22623.1 type II toxin-antitoxin system VapC family toxin [Sulfobacillus harzensis]